MIFLPILVGVIEMNRSKPSQRQLVKWYLSGAIRWQPEIPEGSRIIGVVAHFFGDRVFHELIVCAATVAPPDGQELTLHVNGSVQCFVVPARMKYVFGAPISKIPGNAVPVEVFFGKG